MPVTDLGCTGKLDEDSFNQVGSACCDGWKGQSESTEIYLPGRWPPLGSQLRPRSEPMKFHIEFSENL